MGIGTDGSVTGIDDLAAYQGALEKEIVERVAAGIGARGERADTYPFWWTCAVRTSSASWPACWPRGGSSPG